MDPDVLQAFVELLADGGMIACNAATRDQMLAFLDGDDRTALAARIQAHSWVPQGHIVGVSSWMARSSAQFAVTTST